MKLALALSWDGARCPLRTLPAPAQAFLKRTGVKTPDGDQVARLLADDRVGEIRVCWVPRLLGGADVLCAPFATLDGLRLGFAVVKTKSFGAILGVVYRRTADQKDRHHATKKSSLSD